MTPIAHAHSTGRHSAAATDPWPPEGELLTPSDAPSILAMAITRPMLPSDYQPIALPVLCRRVLADKDRYGTLIVQAGNAEARVDVVAGVAHLDKHELAALMDMFDERHGRYRLTPQRFPGEKREPISFSRIALRGVRQLLKHPNLEELEAAFGVRMNLTPTIKPNAAAATRRMGLSAREMRFLDTYLDGKATADELCASGGIGGLTVLQLLAALELFDVLVWSHSTAQAPARDPHADLAREAARLEHANHFEVLGLHWSVGDAELQAAIATLRARYRPGARADRQNPAACEKLRARIDAAGEALRTADGRAAYRRVAFEGQDFDAIADLAHKRSSALALRGDARAAHESEESAKELERSVDADRSAELRRRAMRRAVIDPTEKE